MTINIIPIRIHSMEGLMTFLWPFALIIASNCVGLLLFESAYRDHETKI